MQDSCRSLLPAPRFMFTRMLALAGAFLLGGVAVAQNAPPPPQPILLPAATTGAGCIIQSDFSTGQPHRNFETVVLQGNDLVHYWHDNQNVNYTWHRGQVITHNATGYGCIIQSDFKSGSHGNFEVVVPEGSNLVHYSHDNSDVTSPWLRGKVITPRSTGPATIIQSDFRNGSHGNFEVVALENRNLVHYWHDNSDVNSDWHQGGIISANATGPGTIIQSDFKSGDHGDLEVVVPEGRTLVHYYHDSSDVNSPWKRGQTISTIASGPASLIQSDFKSGGHGNFEVLVPEGTNLVHHFHDNSNVNNPWQQGQVAATGVAGYAGLIQSDFVSGGHGNFEVVAFHNQQVFHHFHDNSDVNKPWQQAQQLTFASRSQRVCQLTGDYDFQDEHASFNQTDTRFHVKGTDLGYPFEHDGRVYFLFGDTGDHGEDSIADTREFTGENGLHLDFVADGNTFRPISIPNVSLGFFEVPTTGFSANGKMYVFVWTDHRDQMRVDPNVQPCPGEVFSNQVGHAALARSDDNGRTYKLAYENLGNKFVYLSAAVVDSATVPGLPEKGGQGLLLWGSGQCYRQSDVYLAYAPLGQVESKSAILYYTGMNPTTQQPGWLTAAQMAQFRNLHGEATQPARMFAQGNNPCVGEFSVTWNRNLREWLMLYNCHDLNAKDAYQDVLARAATTPWGPWSEPTVLFHPADDHGFCHFIHQDDNCDPLKDPKSPAGDNIGDVYAPYIIPRYTEGGLQSTTIFYTMSTWNPYDVVLMRATLAFKSALPYGPDTCEARALSGEKPCRTITSALRRRPAMRWPRRTRRHLPIVPPMASPPAWTLARQDSSGEMPFPGDHVCVTPAVRTQNALDDATGPARRAAAGVEGPLPHSPVRKIPVVR